MKKKLLVMLVAVVAFVTGASAQINEYRFKVGDFSQLSVYDDINVVYSCNPDSIGYAVYYAERDLNPFMLKVSGKTLKVMLDPYNSDGKNVPTLHVYSNFLTKVVNNSEGFVDVRNINSCPDFKAEQVGNGTIVVDGINATSVNGTIATGKGTLVLRGKCTRAKYVMIGTGSIQAYELKADDVKCSIGGTGSISCYATESLKVGGMGSTTIYVKGNPSVSKKSIGGKIVKIHSSSEDESEE